MNGHEGIHSIDKPKSRSKTTRRPPTKGNGDPFPKLFSGVLGCVKDVRVHLDLDADVKPVRQKLRFHLKDAVSNLLAKDKEIRLGRDGKPITVRGPHYSRPTGARTSG